MPCSLGETSIPFLLESTWNGTMPFDFGESTLNSLQIKTCVSYLIIVYLIFIFNRNTKVPRHEMPAQSIYGSASFPEANCAKESPAKRNCNRSVRGCAPKNS